MRLPGCLGAVALFLLTLLLAAGPAAAQTGGTCSALDDGHTKVTAVQARGRGTITVATDAGRAGQLVWVDYDGESFAARIAANGQAALSMALVSDSIQISVRGPEFSTVHCDLPAPDRAQYFRVVLRWRAPVRMNLHVVEPFRRMWEYGHIRPAEPGAPPPAGIGQIDIITDAIAEDATGEQSYVIEDAARPKDGVFTFRAEYASRGDKPAGDFCETGKFADIEYDLTVLEPGKPAKIRKFRTGAMPCGRESPPNVRFFSMKLR